jgi:hypothetical protein
MERRRQVQLDTGEPEQLALEAAGEDRVPIAHDGAQNLVKPHNAGEERTSDGCGRVGACQSDEMRVLGEVIHHGEYNVFPIHAWQSLHEIHGDVHPHHLWQRQRLEQTGRLQLLGLIPLAHSACPKKVVHHLPRTGHLKISTETMDRFLYTFVAGVVGAREQRWKRCR